METADALMAARSRLPSKPWPEGQSMDGCPRVGPSKGWGSFIRARGYIGHTCYASDGADICADISSEESSRADTSQVGDDLPEGVARLVTGGESY